VGLTGLRRSSRTSGRRAPSVPSCEAAGTLAAGSGHRRLLRRRDTRSRSTIAGDGRLVPWLAADGPLAYHPEQPPERDYYFQYGWVLPEVFAEGVSTRRHRFFGASSRDQASELFSFWANARRGDLDPIFRVLGSIGDEVVAAPIAIYRTAVPLRGAAYVMIQHASYQLVREADQPFARSGELLLYRGLQHSAEFRWLEHSDFDPIQRQIWRAYVEIQKEVLSDAVVSFNSIHDRTSRCETAHLRDRSWMTDDLARARGLDIAGAGFAAALWSTTHQSFALERWVAQNKFGPCYVVCKTPLENVRITTFFAGEHEVRIIDPRRVELVETHGCRVTSVSLYSR
jgi:hypothetical protein